MDWDAGKASWGVKNPVELEGVGNGILEIKNSSPEVRRHFSIVGLCESLKKVLSQSQSLNNRLA